MLAAYDSGSTGADGTFGPASNTTINLALAGTGAGFGVYDSTHWAVVFNYTTVNIPAGVTVQSHQSSIRRTRRVALLGQCFDRGDGEAGRRECSIQWRTALCGARSGWIRGGATNSGRWCRTRHSGIWPGWWTIPRRRPATGPGGGYGSLGANDNTGGGGGGTYGNEAVLPLIGGIGWRRQLVDGTAGRWRSGRRGDSHCFFWNNRSSIVGVDRGRWWDCCRLQLWRAEAGAVGRFVLLRIWSQEQVACAQRGAKGGGLAGDGGTGRIRVEAPTIVLDDGGNPPFTSTSIPGPTFPDANAPSLSVTSVSTPAGNVPVTADPRAGIRTVDTIVPDSVVVPVTVHISASNIPTGTSVTSVPRPRRGCTRLRCFPRR